MGKYDSEKIKGKVVKISLNKTFEKKDGDTYKGHLLVVRDEDDEEHKFKVSRKAKAAKFIEKLDEGQKVTVSLGDNGFLAAVFTERKGFAKTNRGGDGGRDPTGQIQGNTRSNATALVTSGVVKVGEDGDVVKALVDAAKLLLVAGAKIDKMVVSDIKSRKEGEDDDDSDEDGDESEDEDDDSKKKGKKKASKKSSKDDEDSDEGEDEPY